MTPAAAHAPTDPSLSSLVPLPPHRSLGFTLRKATAEDDECVCRTIVREVDPEGAAASLDVVPGMGVLTVGADDVSDLPPKAVRALLDAGVAAKGFGKRHPLEVTFTVPPWLQAEEEEEAEDEEEEEEEEGAGPPGGEGPGDSAAQGPLPEEGGEGEQAAGEEEEEEEAAGAAEEGEPELEAESEAPLPPANTLLTLRFSRNPMGFRFRGDSLAVTQRVGAAGPGGAPDPRYCRCVVTEVMPYCQAAAELRPGAGIATILGIDVRLFPVEDLTVSKVGGRHWQQQQQQQCVHRSLPHPRLPSHRRTPLCESSRTSMPASPSTSSSCAQRLAPLRGLSSRQRQGLPSRPPQPPLLLLLRAPRAAPALRRPLLGNRPLRVGAHPSWAHRRPPHSRRTRPPLRAPPRR